MRRLNERENLFDLAESLSNSHGGNLVSVVCIGVIAATSLATYGLTCVITQQATFIGGRPTRIVEYNGIPAICMGIAYIGSALFMHSHFVWSSNNRFYAVAQAGKFIGAAAIVSAIGYLVFYVVAFT